MALTFRSNGVGGGLVSASWWNDYYNLMTGVMNDQPVTFGNNLTVNGSNGIMFNGKLGVSSVGDVLDASGTTLYLKAKTGGNFHFQDPNGTDQFILSSTNSSIQVNQWLGVRKISGTQLAEFKGDGTFCISGAFYESTNGSIATSPGQSMDSFDVAEVFPCDTHYEVGTIVCPGSDSRLYKCTHDNCPCAMVVSKVPGFGIGKPGDNENYIAMAGRVNVATAQDIPPRSMVCSDGRGGVRTLHTNEGSFVLGFTINSTSTIEGRPMVAIFLRPLFITMKG